MRRITYVGVTFRTRTGAEFEEASEAFERMARNEHFGKIVLSNA